MLFLAEFEALVRRAEPTRSCPCGRRMSYGTVRCNRCGAAHERRLARLLVARATRHGGPSRPEFTPLHFLLEPPADAGPLRRRPGWEANGRKAGTVTPAESARRAEKAAHWHLLLSPTGQYVAVFNLKQFCEANGLDANTLSAQSRGGLCSQGWFVTSDAFPVPREKQKRGPKPGGRPVLAYRKGPGT